MSGPSQSHAGEQGPTGMGDLAQASSGAGNRALLSRGQAQARSGAAVREASHRVIWEAWEGGQGTRQTTSSHLGVAHILNGPGCVAGALEMGHGGGRGAGRCVEEGAAVGYIEVAVQVLTGQRPHRPHGHENGRPSDCVCETCTSGRQAGRAGGRRAGGRREWWLAGGRTGGRAPVTALCRPRSTGRQAGRQAPDTHLPSGA